MFGEYCNSRLNMQWIKLTDPDGTTLVVDGVFKKFRGFPYQTISKRIADSEHGFFSRCSRYSKNHEKEHAKGPRSLTSEEAGESGLRTHEPDCNAYSYLF